MSEHLNVLPSFTWMTFLLSLIFWSFLSFSMYIIGYRGNYITTFDNGRNSFMREDYCHLVLGETERWAHLVVFYLIFYSNLFKTVAVQNIMGRCKYSLNSFFFLQTKWKTKPRSFPVTQIFPSYSKLLNISADFRDFVNFYDGAHFSGSQQNTLSVLVNPNKTGR